jgi:hypothetical protein
MKLIRTVSNGETSVDIYVMANGDVVSEENNYFIGSINDPEIEDKIDHYAEEWREVNWNQSDWADYYGCDVDDVEDCMDDDMRDYDD